MNTQQNTKKIFVQMADCISELDMLLEKINVLTDDIFTNCLEKIDLKSERGRFCAEYDINLARIKASMVRCFVIPAVEKSNLLLALSDEISRVVK